MTTFDRLYCARCGCNRRQVREDARLGWFFATVILGVFASVVLTLLLGVMGLGLGIFLTIVGSVTVLLLVCDLAASNWSCTECGSRYNHRVAIRMAREPHG